MMQTLYISKETPTVKHEQIETYDKLFEFVQE